MYVRVYVHVHVHVYLFMLYKNIWQMKSWKATVKLNMLALLYYYFTPYEFFTPTLELLQVSSGLSNSSEYFNWSKPCQALYGVDYFSVFQYCHFLFQPF